MRYASVCSGVGTCALAWNPLGWESAWFAEVEPFPAAVLAQRFPGVPNHADMLAVLRALKVRLAGGEPGLHVDADIDVLAGGTPCQAFSTSGGRLSLGDPRGNLTLAFCQLAHALNALRPGGLPVVVWENVPGVLNTADNAFGCFLAGLCGEDAPIVPPEGVDKRRWRTAKGGARYFSWPDAGLVVGPARSVAWRVLDAQYFGLAQRRRRVVVVSCSHASGIDPGAVLFEPGGVRRHPPARGAAGPQDAAGVAGSVTGGSRAPGPDEHTHLVPDGGGVARTLNAAGGTGRHDVSTETLIPVPGAAEAVPIAELGKRRGWIKTDGRTGAGIGGHGDPSYTLGTDSRHGVLEPIPFDTTQITSNVNRCRPEPGDQRHPLAAGGHPPAIAFSCKDHGQDAADEVSPTLRSMGHAGSRPNAGGQVAVCVTGDVTHALTSEGHDASEDGSGRGHPIALVEVFRTNAAGEVTPQGDRSAALTASSDPCAQVALVSGTVTASYGAKWGCDQDFQPGPDCGSLYPIQQRRVRRLVPVECERLQGYPDDHTNITFRGRPAADGPRYKAIGNGWACTVFRWVGERVDAAVRAG